MMTDQGFWQNILDLTRADTSVKVPEATFQRACAIFQPEDRAQCVSRIFSLRPAFTGLVRKAGPARKLFYELGDEYIVELEIVTEDRGMTLTGFIHGCDDAPVVLYGEECVYQASQDAGSFSFEALPEGEYAISFSHEGEDFWVTGLQVKKPDSTGS